MTKICAIDKNQVVKSPLNLHNQAKNTQIKLFSVPFNKSIIDNTSARYISQKEKAEDTQKLKNTDAILFRPTKKIVTALKQPKSIAVAAVGTAATVGLGALATGTVVVGCAAAAPAIAIGAGVTLATVTATVAAKSAYDVVKGAINVHKAKNGKESERSYEQMGDGILGLSLSFSAIKPAFGALTKASASAKASLASVNAAGKTGLVKLNFSAFKENAITANSKELRGATKYMSKPNAAQAYRFNPNGAEAGILKNNPGVFKNAQGKYCIPNKWSPENPHIIDPTKEQMIMIYDKDDMAVCDGEIFKGSYVNSKTLKANSSLDYLNPEKLNYGKVIDVTKQAPGAYKIVPEGTKVKTLEGIQVVKEGQVVAIDHAGNPYVTPASNIIKRNILQPEAIKELEALSVQK